MREQLCVVVYAVEVVASGGVGCVGEMVHHRTRFAPRVCDRVRRQCYVARPCVLCQQLQCVEGGLVVEESVAGVVSDEGLVGEAVCFAGGGDGGK